LVIAPIYGLLAWMKSAGYGIAAWVPDPSLDLLRSAGLLYAAWYFLGKAALTANVYTAHFAHSGKRLLAAAWIQRTIGNSKKTGAKQAQTARYKPSVKSVLGIEEKVIQSISEKSGTTGPRE
jgi:hypothetical protein